MTTERRTGRWHEAWATRPARPREGRMIAGVAAGLGRRYDVDPVLIRIGFVVTALYGPGIPLYLLGCVVLPDGGRAGRGRAGTVLSALLLVAAVIGFWILLVTIRGGWFLPLVVTLALLVALHVTRGNRYAPATPVPGPDGPDAPTGTGSGSGSGSAATTSALSTGATHATPVTGVAPATGTPPTDTDTPPTGHAPAGLTPPDRHGTEGEHPTSGTPTPDDPATGDPTTGDPTAYPATAGTGVADGPEQTGREETGTPDHTDTTAPIAPVPPHTAAVPGPATPPPPPRPGMSRITPLTLTCALLAAGVAAVVGLSVPGSIGPVVVPAVALAVVGVGLVAGAFRHAGRWLLPFALLLVCVTWVVAAVPWPEMDGGVGMVADAPRTPGAVLPEYRRGVGDVALDLTGVDLSAPPGTPPRTVRTAARIGVGSVTVRVPRNADLVVHGDTGFGTVWVDGRTRGGDDVALNVTDPGPDGPGGGRIELTLHAAMGSVAVRRG